MRTTSLKPKIATSNDQELKPGYRFYIGGITIAELYLPTSTIHSSRWPTGKSTAEIFFLCRKTEKGKNLLLKDSQKLNRD